MNNDELIANLQRRLYVLEIQFALREVREVRPDLTDDYVIGKYNESGSDSFVEWVAAQRTAGNGVFEYTLEQIRAIPKEDWNKHHDAILAQIQKRRRQHQH